MALKIPYDHSTETKIHIGAEISMLSKLIIKPSEIKVSVIPSP
jgi:hypothetical protein